MSNDTQLRSLENSRLFIMMLINM